MIEKEATKDDPALEISRSGNDVVKKASEVKVVKKGSKSQPKESAKDKDQPTENGDSKESSKPASNGKKHDRDESDKDDEAEEDKKPAKKGKTSHEKDDKAKEANSKKKDDAEDDEAEEEDTTDSKRGRGRPKNVSKVSKEKNTLSDDLPIGCDILLMVKQAKGATKKKEKKEPAQGTRRSSRNKGK